MVVSSSPSGYFWGHTCTEWLPVTDMCWVVGGGRMNEMEMKEKREMLRREEGEGNEMSRDLEEKREKKMDKIPVPAFVERIREKKKKMMEFSNKKQVVDKIMVEVEGTGMGEDRVVGKGVVTGIHPSSGVHAWVASCAGDFCVWDLQTSKTLYLYDV
jgi:hypothetical protein